MIWALLAFVGVPLWLCAVGIMALLYRNRALRTRYGDVPLRVLRPGKSRWVRGHAVWVSDVLAWRGSPAAWNERLDEIVEATMDSATPQEHKQLRHLGDAPAVATLTTSDRVVLRVATTADHDRDLLGPFAVAARPGPS